MLWQPRADHEQKHELGDVTITRGLDATRPITEALQLRSRLISESLGHQDSGIMDGGWIGRGDAGAVGVVVAGRQGSDPTSVPTGTHGVLRGAVSGRPARAGAAQDRLDARRSGG